MRFPRRPPRRPTEPAVPLINVVFLMLVFFLLVGRFREAPRFVVDPPESERGSDAEARPRELWLTRDGRIALEGREIRVPDLADRLEPGAALRLHADAEARARDFLPLLEALDRAGVREIDLATRRDR